MRLTIFINSSDPKVNHEYAVLWLDTDEHIWSRESHEGIDLPAWGEMHNENGMVTLCAPNKTIPLCTLSGLSIDHHQHIRTAYGAAAWSSLAKHELMDGHWRLQAVDRQAQAAENSMFRH